MGEATLNGEPLIRATVMLPRWGIWTADVCVSSDATLSGQASIKLFGLELTGTILDGGPDRNAGWYHIVGGAGGWRQTIPAKAYRNQAGVKLATVLGDAARECGETLGTVPQRQLGPAYSRHEAEAARVLDLVAEDWYVDEQGTTQIGHRAKRKWTAEYVVTRPRNLAAKVVEVASEDISDLLPGAELEGIEAVTIRHELTPSGLRSMVSGALGSWVDRSMAGLLSIIRSEIWHTDYHRITEYKINATASGGYVDIVPMRAAMGLPNLSNIPLRPGTPGGGGVPATGSSCLVAFADGEPTRPVIISFAGEAESAWKPSIARLNASSKVEVGADASTVELAGGSQFVSLANLVDGNLDAIKTALDTIASAAGTSHLYVKNPTAATKTKAT